MRDELEVREYYEEILNLYDKSAEGGRTPNESVSLLREMLEWVLGDQPDKPFTEDDLN